MKKGYQEKILRVDLTTGEIKTETLEEQIYRRYLEGSALASYFLLKEIKTGVDPLGKENVLVFTCSVINGLPVPGATRYTVAAKSPLISGFSEAEADGYCGPS